MAAFICTYSGLEIKASHFPLFLSTRDTHFACHPIFHASQKRLLSYARAWSAGELTNIESYLLYVALLKSTELVYFRTSAQYLPKEIINSEYGNQYTNLGTDSIVAHNMGALMVAISHISAIQNPRIRFPEVMITPENCTLFNSKHWIENWNDIWIEYQLGSRAQARLAKLTEREIALQRMIKTPHKRIESYSKSLAEWANDAASFPTYAVIDEEGKEMTLAEYYMQAIQFCAAKEYFRVNNADIRELIDLCEERIEPGSIQYHVLHEILQNAERYLSAFITSNKTVTKRIAPRNTWAPAGEHSGIGPHGFGDADDNEFLDEDGVEEFTPGLNKIIEETSLVPPVLSAFPNKWEYTKAMIKYKVAMVEIGKRKGE